MSWFPSYAELTYNITTCASVQATGGTLSFKELLIVPPTALKEAQVVILYSFA